MLCLKPEGGGFCPTGFMSDGAFVRRGFCPVGFLSDGAFVRDFFVRGGGSGGAFVLDPVKWGHPIPNPTIFTNKFSFGPDRYKFQTIQVQPHIHLFIK